jgi:hypothetical protein
MTLRKEPNGFHTDITPLLTQWYAIGADRPATAGEMFLAMQDGRECYRAFLAGVMARLFGVNLEPISHASSV